MRICRASQLSGSHVLISITNHGYHVGNTRSHNIVNLIKACASSSKDQHKHKHVTEAIAVPPFKAYTHQKSPIAHPDSISVSMNPNQPVQDYCAYTAGHLGSSSSVKIPCEISSSGCGLRCSFWSRLSASICFSSSFALACSAGAALVCGRMLPIMERSAFSIHTSIQHVVAINLRWRGFKERETHVQRALPDQDDARDVSSGCLLYAGERVLLWLPGEIYGSEYVLVSVHGHVGFRLGRGSW